MIHGMPWISGKPLLLGDEPANLKDQNHSTIAIVLFDHLRSFSQVRQRTQFILHELILIITRTIQVSELSLVGLGFDR